MNQKSESTFQIAQKYLRSFPAYDRSRARQFDPAFNLNCTRELLKLLGNPQNSYKVIHIAGTKGKGSTAAFIESVIRCGGYPTGLYTQPELVDIRERFRISGEIVSKNDFVSAVEEIEKAVEKFPERKSLVNFAVMTALAFKLFEMKKVGYAIIETGLGGRYDPTNVVSPLISIITSISLDHMEVLGDTISQIAYEKAGIIKRNTPIVYSAENSEALAVIEKVAEEAGAPLIRAGNTYLCRYKYSLINKDSKTQTFQINSHESQWKLKTQMLGEHQLMNVTTAFAAIQELRRTGLKISDQSLHNGIASTTWRGRMELLASEPAIVVDGAHNVDSIDKLMGSLREYYNFEKLFVILALAQDKDAEGVIQNIASKVDYLVVTTLSTGKGFSPGELLKIAQTSGVINVYSSDSLHQALQIVCSYISNNDLICITGSLYLVGEAIKLADEDILRKSGCFYP